MQQQLPLIQSESSWCPPSSFPDLTKEKLIAIDLETYDPDLIQKGSGWATSNGHIIGIAVATEDWQGYFPIRHVNGNNLDENLVLDWLQRQLNTSSKKVFHNAMYDIGWLRREGIDLKGQILDTMVASPLIDENRYSYSLNALAKSYLKESKNEDLLRTAAVEWGVNPKNEMYKLPANYVGPYAEQDASLTYRLWNILEKEIKEEELETMLELELALVPILFQMRWTGVRVDLEKAENIKKDLKTKEHKILHKIKKTYGEIEVWNSRSIGRALDKANIPYDRTEKTNAPKLEKEWLLTHKHELPKMIGEARELNKAHTTFIDSVLRYEHNGRVHAEPHQLRSDIGGTVSGRFSYTNPNLQQVPARNKTLGPLIRSIFLPEKGEQWASFDYNQQEPRLVVHYSALMKYPKADEVANTYKEGNADFHQIVAEMAQIPRKQAKNINLGLFYSMGEKKLSEQLGISYNEAQEIFEKYHRRVPFVKMLSFFCRNRASDRGSIKTLLGRKCRFNLWEPRDWQAGKIMTYERAKREFGHGIRRAFTHKALNRLIQGSAADQTKKAMVDLYKEGIVPMIQIHDELCISLKNNEQKETAKYIMENCVKLEIPSEVDVEIGKNWGEIK